MAHNPIKIAGLLQTRNYSDDCSVFNSLKQLSDITIVLDHNSDLPFKYRDRCDEYLVLRNRALWHDLANRTTLLYRALVHGCNWIVSMDDDIVFSHNFQTRNDAVRVIAEMEKQGKDTCLFTLRDLWDSSSHYRVDGVWGRKSLMALRKNWFYYENITLPDPQVDRLHRPVYPTNLRSRGTYTVKFGDYMAYHTGCLTRTQRLHRVDKYKREDPEHPRAYSYMLDTAGIMLEEVPASDRPVLSRKFRIQPPDKSRKGTKAGTISRD
jgi:hypothetical protein